MTEQLSYEDIVEQASHAHVTAETLDILVSKTRELSAQRQHDLDRLETLLKQLEKQLAEK